MLSSVRLSLRTIAPSHLRSISTAPARMSAAVASAPHAPAAAPGTTQVLNHETYTSTGIDSADSLLPCPLEQFHVWFAEAQKFPCPEPEAVAVSTVSDEGIPSTRFVLLKQVDPRGFTFFTNYESRKGKELGLSGGATKGKFASMAFYWREQNRSVRIVGRAEKIATEETSAYFNGRPVGSRVGAWSSPQSTVLNGGRPELEAFVSTTEANFNVQKDAAGKEIEQEIPTPTFWGGVRIVPTEVEYWSGNPSRLHDRFRYTRAEGSTAPWDVVRLAP